MAPAATVPSASTAFIEHGLAVARAAMASDAATCSHKSIAAGRDAYRSYVAAVESLMKARGVEEDKTLKENLRLHAKAYLARATVIRKWLEEAAAKCGCASPAVCTCAGARPPPVPTRHCTGRQL